MAHRCPETSKHRLQCVCRPKKKEKTNFLFLKMNETQMVRIKVQNFKCCATGENRLSSLFIGQ